MASIDADKDVANPENVQVRNGIDTIQSDELSEDEKPVGSCFVDSGFDSRPTTSNESCPKVVLNSLDLSDKDETVKLIVPIDPAIDNEYLNADFPTILSPSKSNLDLTVTCLDSDEYKEEPPKPKFLRSTNLSSRPIDECKFEPNIEAAVDTQLPSHLSVKSSSVDLNSSLSEVCSNEALSSDCNSAFVENEPSVSIDSVSTIYSHPAYKTVIQELALYKEEVSILRSSCDHLELKNKFLEADRSHDSLKVQLQTQDKTCSQQQKEIQQLRELGVQQLEVATKSYTQLKDDLEAKLDKMTRAYEAANRDKESAVMRYALSEKEVIDQKKERESLDKRLKEFSKEKDLLINKLKGLTTDKSRVCQILDSKCNELTNIQKENEKLKEDLNSREIKIKWAQNKLRTEMEIHKETQVKVDKLVKKLQDTREEAEQVRRDCQTMMRSYQSSEENKAYTLDQQVKELQAQLILERHEYQDKDETYRQLQQELESLKKKHQLILNENNLLSIKVQNLEKERLEYEQNLSKLKRTSDDQKQDIVDHRSKLAAMESLRIQLQHEQEKLAASQAEVERLRLSNSELQQDMTACREKEAELLEFTQKLTDKNVRLQSEFSATEAKAQELEFELGPQLRHIAELESSVSVLTQQLEHEKRQRQEENQLLTRHLAEKTQRVDVLARELEDQCGENEVLKRKQTASIKEMVRELNQTRKRLELYDTNGSNSVDQVSRASSISSLNTLEPNIVNTNAASKPGGGQTSSPEKNDSETSVSPEPDRQVLIEHIVKLQRANARKAEKLEFMEEHAQQLVAELQKKTRVLQSYILREQSGALSSESMDQNKAEASRHGGIMASIYGSKNVDESMTLELSLEMIRKLQAVLEDTLLKNITLKDNIETLGDEISRLQTKD